MDVISARDAIAYELDTRTLDLSLAVHITLINTDSMLPFAWAPVKLNSEHCIVTLRKKLR